MAMTLCYSIGDPVLISLDLDRDDGRFDTLSACPGSAGRGENLNSEWAESESLHRSSVAYPDCRATANGDRPPDNDKSLPPDLEVMLATMRGRPRNDRWNHEPLPLEFLPPPARS